MNDSCSDEEKTNSKERLPADTEKTEDTMSNASDVIDRDAPVAFLCTRMGPDGLQKFPLLLGRPHFRKTPSLCEQTRLAINKQTKLWNNLKAAESLPLSMDFCKYLKKYPYPV